MLIGGTYVLRAPKAAGSPWAGWQLGGYSGRVEPYPIWHVTVRLRTAVLSVDGPFKAQRLRTSTVAYTTAWKFDPPRPGELAIEGGPRQVADSIRQVAQQHLEGFLQTESLSAEYKAMVRKALEGRQVRQRHWHWRAMGVWSLTVVLLSMSIALGLEVCFAVWRFLRRNSRKHRRRQGLCEWCGYSLAGLSGGVCPECGKACRSAEVKPASGR